MDDVSRVLRESWNDVEDRRDRISAYFYARLFVAAPQLRDLFPIQLRPQRDRLLAGLGRAVAMVDDPERFDAELRALGRAHRRFDVTAEHHKVFRECLIEAIRVHSVPRWGPAQEHAWRVGYDRMADRMIAGAAEARGPAYRFAEVVRHERRSAEVAVLACRPFPDPVSYRPGQYVPLETDHEPRQWRRYSIANAPRPDGTLEFHVRAVGAGTVSPALVWNVRPGEVVRVGEPAGSLGFGTEGRDVVCLCGGTGLAPVRALIESAPEGGWTRWVHLFFGARTEDGLYDLPALSRLAATRPWLRVVPVVSGDPRYRGERGNLCDVLARRGTWDGHEVVLSGSPAMLGASLHTLRTLGIPPYRIRYDAF